MMSLTLPITTEAPRQSHIQAPLAHLIGIRGSGMTALAEILSDLGWQVSGSDHQCDAVSNHDSIANLKIYTGHHAEQVPNNADIVVFSSAISNDNPERKIAKTHNIPSLSYPEMLAELMKARSGICIAGTHGKSTTSAMTAHILKQAGLDPSAAIGAHMLNWKRSGFAGDGSWFIAESCEYQKNFLKLSPTIGVILGIEHDHFDCFPALEQVVDAFREFAGQIPSSGILLIRGDCPLTSQIPPSIDAEIQSFSLSHGSDWWATNLSQSNGIFRFRVFHKETYFGSFHLNVPGKHNVLNALAAIAVAHNTGTPVHLIQQSLKSFQGLQRRFETVGCWNGVTLINDYAHHPTEIKETLKTARHVFGNRRIWCVFQPHQMERTLALRNDFAKSFALADHVMINTIYAARETKSDRTSINAETLASDIAHQGVATIPCYCRESIVQTLQDQLKTGDVLITMGAGNIGTLCNAFL